MVAARFTEVARLASVALIASTSRILQLEQIAEAMSRSRDISSAQPESTAGSGLAVPFWFTLWKQPFAVVHAGSPNCDRYVPRSASAVGSSCASTIAMVRLELPVLVRLYADRRSAGPRP